ncbi:MAG TPA: tyrosine-protein phosphatase [Bacteroides togonis]|nr:tyrosine-protein phosphatase [Bacteroides togonis]
MYRNLYCLLVLAALLPSCSKTSPRISVVCEENNVGNSVVKWETIPEIPGEVKVYASEKPDHTSAEHLVASAPISDQHLTIITTDPMRRYYYRMVFAEKYKVDMATRNINIPGIQNFRDLGGYPSYPHHKFVRWGMLYRSGEINRLRKGSLKKLKNLGIRTIIDLRSPEEKMELSKSLEKNFSVVSIPIATGNMEQIINGVQDRSIRSDTVYRIVERMNRELITKYAAQYRKVFDLLLNEDNYPVVIHCSSGKGRTGIVSALILACLDVNEDKIMEDYRLSNDYFNIPRATRYAYNLPVRSQEAITTLFSAREDFLNAAKEEAERQYGNIKTYLREGIGLSKQEMKHLRNILLTKQP